MLANEAVMQTPWARKICLFGSLHVSHVLELCLADMVVTSEIVAE